jgi:transcriptional repressor NrdR
MRCPFCLTEETKVVDSRLGGEGDQVRRRRECIHCAERFTTYETAELNMPRLVKSDNTRESFDENKLRQGLLRALQKRPVGSDVIEDVVNRLKHRLRATGEREVKTRVLGEWVMEELRSLDEVAYVRFASVYHRFQDVSAFHDEIARLREPLPHDDSK